MPWADADRRPTLWGPLNMLTKTQEAISVSVGITVLLADSVPQWDHTHRETWQVRQCASVLFQMKHTSGNIAHT